MVRGFRGDGRDGTLYSQLAALTGIVYLIALVTLRPRR
jgi:hypothetical protein